ncbi:DUF481 domain-containing protein [Granulicella sp. L46]|jgi:hypothetical protein|uniref:DUF481 domain-containing protein n=1 Tax=Granulicella sp. L46 TaxID=1641865 RepID=UPI00131C5993|nr:DUF481 domain-containing protein [Granulicella sp. L46]
MNIHDRLPFLSSSVWTIVFLFVLSATCWARDKKDVIVFANGDRMTCEIMQLQKGYLYVRLANGEGTIAVDWTKVVRIESQYNFIVTNEKGERFISSLKKVADEASPDKFVVEVTGSPKTDLIPSLEIVALQQNDVGFWANLHGSIDSGLNYTKQQNRVQYNFDSSVVYAKPLWSAGVDLGSSFSGGGSDQNFRLDLQTNVARQLRSPRNVYMGLVGFQHNGEQNLDLRTILGGAVGHNFRMTNTSLIAAYVGADWNNEHYEDDPTSSKTGNSAEAVVGTQFNFFRFRTTNFLVNTQVFPSITDPGRVRLDLNAAVKLRLARRLYWSVSYYLNYDSRPPQNLNHSDFGTAGSIGWKF